MTHRINDLRRRISAALFPATPIAEPPSAEGANEIRERLGDLRHMAIPPLPDPPEGLIYLEDRRLAHIADLDEQQRWHRETMEPLMIEWAERYLELCDLSARIHAAMDERERRWGVRQTARARAGQKTSGVAFSLDRNMKIERTYSDRVAYDDLRMKRAHELMEQCVEEWEAGGRNEIKQIVSLSFRKNSKGLYSRVEMTRLLKIKSADPRWQEAVQLIREAEIVDGVAAYLMMAIRDERGKFIRLPLDIASVRPLAKEAA